ncbi:MAG TPA: hypothetical protein ENK05_03735 [Gammaproteobacteria bacterium]|nr:hypothetical protein [Gammaproteobacteria bacterium]
MSDSIQQTLSRSVLAILRPLVRILLRNGIAYGSFAELAKKVYVDVAFDEFAPDGRKQTISRVSALTGLTRKEAKRLHELEHPLQSGSEQRYNRAVRVISGWLNDDEFQAGDGRTAELPVEGERGSFAALVRKYSGDVPTQSMLAVLQSAGVIERDEERVRLVKHAYVPGNDPVDKLAILGTDTCELISTIDHNIVSDPQRLRFQRKVSDQRLRKDALPAFEALSAEKAQALLEELDAWLAEHQVADGEDGHYVSLGIYYYESSREKKP